MLLRTIAHLIENDGVDSRITRILETTDIFFLPTMNPDGFVKARVRFFFIKAKLQLVRLYNIINSFFEIADNPSVRLTMNKGSAR